MVIGIRLLGRFAAERDGREVAPGLFGGRLARRLLRLLRLLALRRGTLVPKDQIADALWPRDPPADPAGNIEVLAEWTAAAYRDPVGACRASRRAAGPGVPRNRRGRPPWTRHGTTDTRPWCRGCANWRAADSRAGVSRRSCVL